MLKIFKKCSCVILALTMTLSILSIPASADVLTIDQELYNVTGKEILDDPMWAANNAKAVDGNGNFLLTSAGSQATVTYSRSGGDTFTFETEFYFSDNVTTTGGTIAGGFVLHMGRKRVNFTANKTSGNVTITGVTAVNNTNVIPGGFGNDPIKIKYEAHDSTGRLFVNGTPIGDEHLMETRSSSNHYIRFWVNDPLELTIKYVKITSPVLQGSALTTLYDSEAEGFDFMPPTAAVTPSELYLDRGKLVVAPSIASIIALEASTPLGDTHIYKTRFKINKFGDNNTNAVFSIRDAYGRAQVYVNQTQVIVKNHNGEDYIVDYNIGTELHTYDLLCIGSDVKLYIDGVFAVASQKTTGSAGTGRFNIAALSKNTALEIEYIKVFVPQEVSITNRRLTSGGQDVTSLIADSKIAAEYTASNYSNQPKNYAMTMALYDESNLMVSCVPVESAIPARSAGVIEGPSMTLPNNVSGHSVKVFMWEGLRIFGTPFGNAFGLNTFSDVTPPLTSTMPQGDSIEGIKMQNSDDTIHISGRLSSKSADAEVILAVVNPGYSYNDVTTDNIADVAVHYDQVTTNQDGAFEFELSSKLSKSIYPAVIYSDKLTEVYTLDINLIDFDENILNILIKELEKVTAEGLHDLLSSYSLTLKLPIDDEFGFQMLDTKSKEILIDKLKSQATLLLLKQTYADTVAVMALNKAGFDNIESVVSHHEKTLGISFASDLLALNSDSRTSLMRHLLNGREYSDIDSFKSYYTDKYRSVKDAQDKGPSSGDRGIGGGGGGGGGRQIYKTDQVKQPLVPIVDVNNTGGNTHSAKFLDLEETAWAEKDIAALSELGIINGVTATTYEPLRDVKREEFLKVLLLALDIPTVNGGTRFEDVDKSQWYAGFVAGALEAGIITGISDVEFGIGQAITREQAAVMMKRALLYKGVDIPVNEYSQSPTAFDDFRFISEYAVKAVEYFNSRGIILGINNNFEPLRSVDRASAAVLINRLFNSIKAISEGVE